MIYWITIPIAILSLGALGAVFALHWDEILLIDPDSIKEERLRRKRQEIVEQRFLRLRTSKAAPIKAIAKRGADAGKRAFHAAYIRLVQLDRFYKQAKSPFAHMAPTTAERIRALLDDARSLARDLKWGDAERRYVEVLGMDERNVDAYKGLGTLYLKQKLFTQAKETFEFLVQLKKADGACYAGLAEIAQAEGDQKSAEQMYLKALELQPRLAQRYAELASFYLDTDQPEKAKPMALQAVEREPKSAKYAEMLLETHLRLGKRDEARRVYDSLRLLTEDRQRLDALKERIDHLTA